MDSGIDHVRATLADAGQPSYRFTQLLQAYRQNFATDLPRIPAWPKALTESYFAERAWRPYRNVTALIDPEDATRKWIIELNDQNRIQAVMIPDEDRRTLCLSSQVGCALACSFCSTGDMGFVRQLGAGEIVGQWLLVDRALRADGDRGLSHIVFMGMGEPLANEVAVHRALAWFTSNSDGLGLSPQRITVSTVVPRLDALERLITQTRVNVAISLHAADAEVRGRIVPAQRAVAAAAIAELLRKHRAAFRHRKLTLELVMIPGVNDRLADAKALIGWLRGLNARVNLIPFNPYPGSRFQKPDPERVLAFQDRLKRAGFATFVRRTRGERILAACGTLNTNVTDWSERRTA